jgi:HPt (histidine-containing phosphotransfer) domain-containing protein
MHDLFDPTSIELLIEDLGESATREVLQLFFTDSAARLDRLHEDGAAPDSKSAACYARSLKNAAAAFGFMGLAELAQSLEADADSLSAPEIAARARALSDALATARSLSPLQ